MRKIELTEDDFLLILDVKRSMETILQEHLNKLNQVLTRHEVRDPAWKGQIVPFEAKRLKIKEEG